MKFFVVALALAVTLAHAFTPARPPVHARGHTRLHMAVSKDDLVGAQQMIDGILDEKNW